MRRFLVKLLLLLLLLFVGQVAVAYIYPAEIPSKILQFQAMIEEGVDILYLGDSTLWHPLGTQTTAAMLQELLPTRRISEFSHAAYGMDVYRSYITYLLRQNLLQAAKPQLVIIPIHMRSFSPEWDLRPGYQFTLEKRILAMGIPMATILGRPLSLFGGYQSDITQDEFLRSTVYNGATPVGQVQDFEGSVGVSPLTDQNVAQNAEQFVYYQDLSENADYPRLLTYYYLNELQPDHRKVRAMVDIVRQLQAEQIAVLFYITPVNVELGDVYVGESFRRQFMANVAVVQATLAAEGGVSVGASDRAQKATGVTVLDLSFDLAAYFFSDTEHLRQTGKHYIADQLAAAIDPTTLAPPPTSLPAVDTPVLIATPMPAITRPANPLLATAVARATQAAGRDSAVTPTAPAVAPVTPITNPLLATAVMRATAAAAQQ